MDRNRRYRPVVTSGLDISTDDRGHFCMLSVKIEGTNPDDFLNPNQNAGSSTAQKAPHVLISESFLGDQL